MVSEPPPSPHALAACDGSEEPILSNAYCEIPMSALRLDPYNLVFD